MSMSLPSDLPPSPPLTPKSSPTDDVDALLSALRLVARGRLPSPRRDQYSFPLPPAAWPIFQARLSAEAPLLAWFTAHARYDYTPDPDGTFVLRMPGKVHENFIASFNSYVVREILPKLSALDERLSGLGLGGSRTLSFEPEQRGAAESAEDQEVDEGSRVQEQAVQDKQSRPKTTLDRSPDTCIVYNGRDYHYKWPALVAEVSYTQQRRALPHLADDYILETNFQIRCVLAFDVPDRQHPKTKDTDMTAVVYLWRPGFNAEEEAISEAHVDAVPFRSADGKPCDGELTIEMADLIPNPIYQDLPQRIQEACPKFTISFAQLSEWLDSAERETFVPNMPPLARKRRRALTPEEVLGDERERKFRKQEQVADALTAKGDGTWKGTTTGRTKAPITPRMRQSERLNPKD
ncbi:uncharacterized protein CLAFUR5_14649 [Fulvia fulva]|uniref:Uncharacterized protein n=1 Tax=Passalora fulva TaxID=5499 RepID=A0A9Q8PN21_PASFU|nr:uncharacterized protein CLAFUR5_14649 [Fulvia fulva]KAK4608884.1 hypothetical protein CLAFUR0_14859 [Fulvia fulva]UJO25417.1 hypothetical protein CLAFUR5_14649 [Fulvia fulva]